MTQREISLHELASYLPAMLRRMTGRTYTNRRVIPFEGSFVHRHRLTGTRRDGARVAAECCAIVSVADGTVKRIDEYLDARQQAADSS